LKNLENLIKLESSALQCLHSVLPKIKNTNEKEVLTSIWQDHLDAINKLKKKSHITFQEEEMKTGPWVFLVTTFFKGASFLGDRTTLRALKFGEEHSLNEYREFMKNPENDSNLKELIQNEIIPIQEKHIRTIDNFLH
jgi:hypothetical protein